MWKDLQIIIKGKISEEEEGSLNLKEIKEPISPNNRKDNAQPLSDNVHLLSDNVYLL